MVQKSHVTLSFWGPKYNCEAQGRGLRCPPVGGNSLAPVSRTPTLIRADNYVRVARTHSASEVSGAQLLELM